jgi:hypothetical protein
MVGVTDPESPAPAADAGIGGAPSDEPGSDPAAG